MLSNHAANQRIIRKDPLLLRALLIGFTFLFLGFMVVGPTLNVLYQAFYLGWDVFAAALMRPDVHSAFRVTLIAAFFAVAFNMTFGLAAAWAIARFHFRGKALLTALIDLPFSVSPIIAGLIFVLLFGTYGYFGPFLKDTLGLQIIFALPGIILATMFVTFPFVARELIPVMEALGPEEEEASRTLGASAWQMFWYITLPNIKWGLLYGVLLCNARAVGEFGAVNVVSGRIPGKTETLPVSIERIYEGLSEEAAASAFAVATLLVAMALVTLVLKTFLEWKTLNDLKASQKEAAKDAA